MERLGISSIDGFLTENIHFLSNFTKAEEYITWLRSKGVLSESDQEEIMHYPSSKKRTAKLIDVVRLKGENGFVAFMQVLEWDHPDIFKSLTKLVPNPPPSCFKASREKSRVSVTLLKELQGCMSTLLGDNIEKKVAVEKLKKTVCELETENEKMIKEIEGLKVRLEEANDKEEELSSTNQGLQKRVAELEKEKQDLSAKLDEGNLQMVRLVQEHVGMHDNEKQEIDFKDHFQKMTIELNEKRQENAKLNEKVTQILSDNKDYRRDLVKARQANDMQRKTISDLEQTCLMNGGRSDNGYKRKGLIRDPS